MTAIERPRVRVDIGFTPRTYQAAAHELRERNRFTVLVWHRRAGKTVWSIPELLMAAMLERKARPRFGYIAPELKQAKAVAWDILKAYAARVPGVTMNESELYVRLPHNNAQVRLFGADNAEAMRGLYFDGIVGDEVADWKPHVWSSILRPALADRPGWATFIGTPKGVNVFSELYYRALRGEEGWGCSLLRASESGVIPAGELAMARREMTAAQYAQEFECDFNAAVDNVLLQLSEVQASQELVVTDSAIEGAPKVLGIDVARYGGDRTVFCPRQGLVAFKPHVHQGLSTMDTAAQAAMVIERWQPDAVFVDQGGVGGGVVDRLRQLGFSVVGVDFGGKPIDARFSNKRTEMWWQLADWVREGGSLPSGQEWQLDLCAPRISYANARGRLELESKDAMRERGLPSPDIGDAFALTFAAPVARREERQARKVGWDYDPLKES